jgi:sugar lactone lactonase YvrE
MVRIVSSPQCIWEVGATLAEGPVWHAAERAFYFVDIKGRRLHRCNENGGERLSWQAPAEIGFALPMAGGDFICGLQGKLARFSTAGKFETVLEIEAGQPGNRCNDGYIDANGRLWFGTMDNGESAPTGSLYRLDARGLHAMDGNIIITNGPCHSPDGKTFYHTDTLARVVYAYDSAPDGTLSNKREFVSYAHAVPGHPDGSAVDAEGHVWISLFGGSRIERYAPDGKLAQTVPMPCPNITKVAFGGADLRTVFVTTARKGMSEEALAAHPLAGGVFTFRVDAPGLPQHQFDRKAA